MIEPYGLFPTEYRTFEKEDGSRFFFQPNHHCLFTSASQVCIREMKPLKILFFVFCSFIFLKGHCGILGVNCAF